MYTYPTNKTISINPILITLLTMALASLACLQTSISPTYPADSDPAPTETASPAGIAEDVDSEPAAGAVYEIPTQAPDRCASVIAYKSLHIRALPSETAKVTGYLYYGESVTVSSWGTWARIQAGDRSGYARSKYLQLEACR